MPTETGTIDERREGAPPRDESRKPRGRLLWWLFRGTLCLLAFDAVLQAVLAGRFLSGAYPMLNLHQLNATSVGVLSFVDIVVAVAAWRACRGPGSLALASVVLSAAIVAQIALGFRRVLGLHIPLGVTVIGLACWLALWVCTHQPQDRPFGRRAAGTGR
ncbi:hypothetical protein ORV05_23140 [Amycolatopsis cynarae]|uniref:Uncharacterized protein n=1 Tax=Amycolatopsis cynarae TaxID=2995223 RepID=A0ABY7AY68_9PSEU|nr:hypothetical protein [Amycolatopsis sp. HUAS 11-8]WAL63877.1 hypothetical protein ORV05_23140 [Amycolatopsis sp. HUAS 11-8]